MKRFLTILLAGLLIVAVTAPAIAWEYNMKGDYEFRFRYLGRTGQNDLFGKPVSGIDVGFAGPNIYGHGAVTAPLAVPANTAPLAGKRIIAGGYSTYGSDALYYDSRLTLYPEIRVNPAIRVHGTYTVGGFRNKFAEPAADTAPGFPTGIGVPPFERYYMHQTSDAAYNTAAIGSWEQFRATIQLPWGIWSIGVKDFPFGTGATLSNNVRAESFLWVVPYGPFRFLWPIWLARSVANSGWNTEPDGNRKPSLFTGFAFQYLNGDLDLGGGPIIWRLTHQYAGHDTAWTAAGQVGRAGNDNDLGNWGFYGKYNNGRFFLNAEYVFTQSNTTPAAVGNLASLTPTQRNAICEKHAETYHWFLELGAMAGPAKVTFMAATASGNVLNYENPTKVYAADSINYQAMQPYQWLIFDTYGGGNDTFNPDGTGEMSDAFCYAARIDYAVASNLNVWATYLWAHRLEKQGYLFGGKSSVGGGGTQTFNPASVPPGTLPFVATAGNIPTFAGNAGRSLATANIGGVFVPTYGYPSDGYLGWEANAGVDWKILENLTLNFRYAYWQPGEWFKEAYQTLGLVNNAVSFNAVLESRDPINAFNGSLMIDF